MPRAPLPFGDRTAVKSAIASKQPGAAPTLLLCGQPSSASGAAAPLPSDAFAEIARTYRYHPRTSADPP